MKLAPALALLAGLLAYGQAHAARPGDWVLGVAPSYAYIVVDSKAEPKGVGASGVLLYSVTDAIALRLSGGWSGHAVDSTGPNSNPLYQVWHAMAGLRYSFDLVSVNAALEGGLGVLYQSFGKTSSVDAGAQFGVGLDYWILRWLSVGAYFHYYAFLSNPTKYPVYFDAGPRIELRWPG